MPLSWNEIRDRSVEFIREWEGETSEHAEAKSFWDAFFQVFGVSRRRLAAFERHVKKINGKDGYIDLFWPGMLLAEHKSFGKNLNSAYDQATDYFPGLSDKELPRYIIVSDFAHFRIRNLDTGDSTEFKLADLSKNLHLFGFIAGYETREYKEQDPVNIKAAQKLAELHDTLKAVGYEGHELEVYLVRILFCLFADDTGIFMPRGAFEDFIRERTSEDGTDLAPLLNLIFQTLNTPPEKRLKNLDEQITSFPYINGKLYEEYLPQASFDRSMRETLLACCELDWGGISPAIFGSLFQGIMDSELRRNLGAHYTSEKNIQKVIGPLFMDDLWSEYKKIKSQRTKLDLFHKKLSGLNFFDPACGCGNFLVISYRELRLLELEVIKKLYVADQQQLSMDAVSQYVKVDVDQFHGIEVEEWPAQIARVAMWLMDHQMNLLVGEAFGHAVVRIPLIKSANVVHGNALTTEWKEVIAPEKCSYVFGNPPFLGHHLQTKIQKMEMTDCYLYTPRPGVMDFVTAWYCKTADFIKETNVEAAFVSTNSITQGEQVGILWRELLQRAPLKIHFAHRTFKWRNEAKGIAAVYCVIVGFSVKKNLQCRLFDYESVNGEAHEVPAKQINAYLVDAPWALLENRSKNPFGMPEMKYGSKPTDNGNFFMADEEKINFLLQEPNAALLIRPFIGAYEYLHAVPRWTLWLADLSPSDLKQLPSVLARVKAVDAFRKASKAKSTRDYPYPMLYRQITQPNTDYILIPRHSSEMRPYIPFGFFNKDVIIGDSCFALPHASLFHYGVIQSEMHMAWVRSVCGRIKSDYRYSKDIVYNNFPWPLAATAKHKEAITAAAQGVLDARMAFTGSSLAALYDPLSMPPRLMKAHKALDRAVDSAYVPNGGKRSWPTEAERVAYLFELYHTFTS
tara:strand:+ start:2684 stop:5407 length:2724 start_codon:yes stop_codon:yes gene_type:complete